MLCAVLCYDEAEEGRDGGPQQRRDAEARAELRGTAVVMATVVCGASVRGGFGVRRRRQMHLRREVRLAGHARPRGEEALRRAHLEEGRGTDEQTEKQRSRGEK